jgi:hypothetical protein
MANGKWRMWSEQIAYFGMFSRVVFTILKYLGIPAKPRPGNLRIVNMPKIIFIFTEIDSTVAIQKMCTSSKGKQIYV